MKIVHTSDWHVGKTLKNRSRHDEHSAVLAEIAGIARDERADVVIVAGDLFDSAAPSPEAERLVYKALLDLAATGATVAVLAGNHDSERRLQAVQPLLELGSVVARPLPAADATLRIETRGGEVAMLGMLPWVGKHHVVRAEQLMEMDAAQTQQEYWQRVAAMIARVCEPMGPDTVNLLAAHLTIVGADPGEEVRQAHLFDYAVPATVFPASLHYVALGHFHTPQALAAPCPTWYAGSPLHLGFGSIEQEQATKGVVVIDAAPGRPAQARLAPVTAGRNVRTLRGSLSELQAMAGSYDGEYLRIFVREQARAGLARQVQEWFPDAVEVRVDSGEAPQGSPVSMRGGGRPPHDLFVDYLTERNAVDERVVAMFDALVEEAHASDPA